MDTQALVEHLEAAGDLLKQEQPEQALMHLLDIYEAGVFSDELSSLLRTIDEDLSLIPDGMGELIQDLLSRTRGPSHALPPEEEGDDGALSLDFSISDFFDDIEGVSMESVSSPDNGMGAFGGDISFDSIDDQSLRVEELSQQQSEALFSTLSDMPAPEIEDFIPSDPDPIDLSFEDVGGDLDAPSNEGMTTSGTPNQAFDEIFNLDQDVEDSLPEIDWDDDPSTPPSKGASVVDEIDPNSMAWADMDLIDEPMDDSLFEASIGAFAREHEDEESEPVSFDLDLDLDFGDVPSPEEILSEPAPPIESEAEVEPDIFEDLEIEDSRAPERSLFDRPKMPHEPEENLFKISSSSFDEQEDEDEDEGEREGHLFGESFDDGVDVEPLSDPSPEADAIEDIEEEEEVVDGDRTVVPGFLMSEPIVSESSELSDPSQVGDSAPAPQEFSMEQALFGGGADNDPDPDEAAPLDSLFDDLSFGLDSAEEDDALEESVGEESVVSSDNPPSLEGFFDDEQGQQPWFDMGSRTSEPKAEAEQPVLVEEDQAPPAEEFELDLGLDFDSEPAPAPEPEPVSAAPPTYRQDDGFSLDFSFDDAFADDESNEPEPDESSNAELELQDADPAPSRPSWLSAAALEQDDVPDSDNPPTAQVPVEPSLLEDSLFDNIDFKSPQTLGVDEDYSIEKFATVQEDSLESVRDSAARDNQETRELQGLDVADVMRSDHDGSFANSARESTAVIDRDGQGAHLFQSLLENSRDAENDSAEEGSSENEPIAIAGWGDADPSNRETQSNPAIKLPTEGSGAHDRETRANPALTPEMVHRARAREVGREPTAEPPGLFDNQDWSVEPEPAGMPGLEDDWFAGAGFDHEPDPSGAQSVHENQTAIPGVTDGAAGEGELFQNYPPQAAEPEPEQGEEESEFDFDFGFDGPQIEEVQHKEESNLPMSRSSVVVEEPEEQDDSGDFKISPSLFDDTPEPSEGELFDFDLGLSSPDVVEPAPSPEPSFAREKTPTGAPEPDLLDSLFSSDVEDDGGAVRGTMFGMSFNAPSRPSDPSSTQEKDVSEDEFFALAESIAAENSVVTDARGAYRGEPVMARTPVPQPASQDDFGRENAKSRQNPFAHEAPTGVRKALVEANSSFVLEEIESDEVVESTPEEQARAHYDSGRFIEARELLIELIKQGEGSWASGLLDQVERELEREHLRQLGSLSKTPVINVKMSALSELNLDHRSGFLLSQIDGFMTFEDILDLSAMTKLETMSVLVDLLEREIIATV